MEATDTPTNDASIAEADATIKVEPRTRIRSRRACLACNKKKVRCDRDEQGGGPCTQCSKRADLAEQCVIDDDTIPRPSKPREKKRTSEVAFGDESRDFKPSPHPHPPTPALLDGIQSASEGYNQTPHTNGVAYSYGPPSSDRRVTGGYSHINHNAEVKYSQYASPYDTPKSGYGWPQPNGSATIASLSAVDTASNSTGQQLSQILPAPRQTLRYFDVYKSMCHPLYPLFEDIDEFESDVCKYTDNMNKGRLLRELETLAGRQLEQRLSWLASMTAVIAMGVQYSDLPGAERVSAVQDYTRRAMQLLRQANYLLRPTIHCVTTLVLVARILEDNLEVEAARSLLGMMADVLARLSASRSRTGWALAWQDRYVSLALGVPHTLNLKPISASTTNLTYTDCMFTIASAASAIVVPSNMSRELHKSNFNTLNSLLRMYDQALPRLSDKEQCRTIQQRVEHFALRIQYDFVVLSICRNLWPLGHAEADTGLAGLCRSSATSCIQAYIDLKSFSTIASRSWLLTFAALDAALTLPRNVEEIDKNHDPELRRALLTSMAESDGEATSSPQLDVRIRYAAAFERLQHLASGDLTYLDRTDELAKHHFANPADMWRHLFSADAEVNQQAMGTNLSQQLMFGI